MKRVYTLATGAAVVAVMTLGALSLKAGDKVAVCHVEGMQSGRAHVIEISVNAVLKHLGHGDSLEGAAGLNPGDDCVTTSPEPTDTTS